MQPAPLRRPGQHNWIHRLPLKMRFKRSKLYVSAIPVVVLGIGIGFLGALLGLLVLAVAIRFLFGLVTPPDEPFSLTTLSGSPL